MDSQGRTDHLAFTLPRTRPTLDELSSWLITKNGLSMPRVRVLLVRVGKGRRYDRCRPLVRSRYGWLSNSGGVRSAPSSMLVELLPRITYDAVVCTSDALPPTVRLLESARVAFTRTEYR